MDKNFRKRIQKTLYSGQLESAHNPLNLTEVAVEFFQDLNPSEPDPDQVDLEMASEISSQETVSPASMVMSMMYARRLQRKRMDHSRKLSSSDLFLISMMMASKYLYDEGVDEEVFNDEWAENAGVDNEEINKMELDFLDALEWELFIREEDFEQAMLSIEKSIAMREGQRRGWFSYTDLCVLLEGPWTDLSLSGAAREGVKVMVLSSAVYCVAVMGCALMVTAGMTLASSARTPPSLTKPLTTAVNPQLTTAVNPQPLTTALSPQLTTAVNPQLTTAVNPQLTTAVNPQPLTTAVSPQLTTAVRPQPLTTAVSPQLTTAVHPQPLTTAVNPQLTTAVHPQLTTAVHPQLTTAVHPQLTTAVHPQLTTAVSPQPLTTAVHPHCLSAPESSASSCLQRQFSEEVSQPKTTAFRMSNKTENAPREAGATEPHLGNEGDSSVREGSVSLSGPVTDNDHLLVEESASSKLEAALGDKEQSQITVGSVADAIISHLMALLTFKSHMVQFVYAVSEGYNIMAGTCQNLSSANIYDATVRTCEKSATNTKYQDEKENTNILGSDWFDKPESSKEHSTKYCVFCDRVRSVDKADLNKHASSLFNLLKFCNKLCTSKGLRAERPRQNNGWTFQRVGQYHASCQVKKDVAQSQTISQFVKGDMASVYHLFPDVVIGFSTSMPVPVYAN